MGQGSEQRRWRWGRAAMVCVIAVTWVLGVGSTGNAAPAVPVPIGNAADYETYIPTALKEGQFFYYTCEFDAAWVVLKTFGYDVPFDDQLDLVGHDQSIEPYYQDTQNGVVIYGGDITTAFSGDYRSNLLARTTGKAMTPLFEAYDLEVRAVHSEMPLRQALDEGALIWMKATVDFLPWQPTTWITPDGEEIDTVLGNDHAVVAIGYNEDVVVIRDVLGPTDTNWNRSYEYEVDWDTFMAVWEAQEFDGLAVSPNGIAGGADGPSIPAIEVAGSA